jgi:hypothetical protein
MAALIAIVGLVFCLLFGLAVLPASVLAVSVICGVLFLIILIVGGVPLMTSWTRR